MKIFFKAFQILLKVISNLLDSETIRVSDRLFNHIVDVFHTKNYYTF